MIQLLKNIFGLDPKANLKALIQNGAQIIDMRTKSEFKSGHIDGIFPILLSKVYLAQTEHLYL